jgi:uncharacterized protein involved in type VI secretion and phage assembly
MAAGFVDGAAGADGAAEQRIFGVAVAQVIDNVDVTGGARVQLRLPWMPGFEPWARVAAVFAGDDRGAFFIPQAGDEVLVAFNHGDVRDPYVLGGLWNGRDAPPAKGPTDAIAKRIIRTPKGHEIELDDLAQSVTVKTSTGHQIKLEPEKVELQTKGGSAKVTLETSGAIKLSANTSLELKAPSIKLDGSTLDLKGSGSATLDGGGACTVKAGVVKIN